MRMLELRTPYHKGSEADIAWAPLTVLFGANNSGKSNLLEAIVLGLGGTVGRADPLIDWDVGDVESEGAAILECDEAIPGDRAFLCEVLQYGDPDWTLGTTTHLTYTQAKRREQIWDDGGGEPFGPLGLETLRRFVKADLIAAFRRGHVGDWEARSADVETVVGFVAAARHVIVRSYGSQLAVSLEHKGMLASGGRLWEAREEWPDGVPLLGLLRNCVEGGTEFDGWWDIEADAEVDGLPLWDLAVFSTDIEPAIVASSVETALGEVLQRGRWRRQWGPGFEVRREREPSKPKFSFKAVSIEEVREMMKPRLRLDPWLVENENGVSLKPALAEFCTELSAMATEIAPPFIKDSFEVVVSPLSPGQWQPNNGRRVRLAIRERSTGRHFDLRVAGSGIALWAAISIMEGVDRLGRPHQIARSPAGQLAPPETGDEDEYFIARAQRMRVYLIDEPERHLHPVAQREAAAWIAELAQLPGAPSVVVATHSPAFLNLSSQVAQYIGVVRDDGLTQTRVLNVGQLDRLAKRLGLARADLIQLVRAVLIVEGKHDKMVVEHFFGDDVSRMGARVVPIRGTANKSGIPESAILAELGVPIVILFDDVHASFIDGTREAETSEEKHLRSLREQWKERDPGQDMRLIVFPLPDIFAALPEEAVRRAVEGRGGRMPTDGMDGILTRYRAADASNYKGFLADECSVSREQRDIDRLLLRILNESHGSRPHAALRNAVYQAVGNYEDIGPPS
jgi:hypothetical protein